MQDTVDERLHMKAVHEPNGAHPKQSRPSEKKIAKTNRDKNQRGLKPCPRHVPGPDQIRTPLFHGRRIPLIEPSQVSPPESAVPRAGNVINCFGFRMMIAMICDPGV